MQHRQKIHLIVFRFLQCLILLIFITQQGYESKLIAENNRSYERKLEIELNINELNEIKINQIKNTIVIDFLKSHSGSYMH